MCIFFICIHICGCFEITTALERLLFQNDVALEIFVSEPETLKKLLSLIRSAALDDEAVLAIISCVSACTGVKSRVELLVCSGVVPTLLDLVRVSEQIGRKHISEAARAA